MKKLKLDLNELRIQTFDPEPSKAAPQKGTVFGFLPTVDDPSCTCACPEPSDNTCGDPTCTLSCETCLLH